MGRIGQVEAAASVGIKPGVPVVAVFEQLHEIVAAVAVEVGEPPAAPGVKGAAPVGFAVEAVAGLLIVDIQLAVAIDTLVGVGEIRQPVAIQLGEERAGHPALGLEQRRLGLPVPLLDEIAEGGGGFGAEVEHDAPLRIDSHLGPHIGCKVVAHRGGHLGVFGGDLGGGGKTLATKPAEIAVSIRAGNEQIDMAVAVAVGDVADESHPLAVGQRGDQFPGEQLADVARVARCAAREAVDAIGGVKQQLFARVRPQIGEADGDDLALDFHPRRLGGEPAIGALMVDEQFPPHAGAEFGVQQIGPAIAVYVFGDQFVPVVFALQLESGVILRQRGATDDQCRGKQQQPRSRTPPAAIAHQCESPPGWG